MTEQKLRVTEIKPADPNYVHEPVEPSIEPHPDFGGLRVQVVAPKGSKLVAGHPAIHSAAERAALAKLGTQEK
jgi:hypothetical protein